MTRHLIKNVMNTLIYNAHIEIMETFMDKPDFEKLEAKALADPEYQRCMKELEAAWEKMTAYLLKHFGDSDTKHEPPNKST